MTPDFVNFQPNAAPYAGYFAQQPGGPSAGQNGASAPAYGNPSAPAYGGMPGGPQGAQPVPPPVDKGPGGGYGGYDDRGRGGYGGDTQSFARRVQFKIAFVD